MKLLQVSIPAELVHRLDVAAAVRETSRSALVAKLLESLPPVPTEPIS
jgi:hypothetical protein